jgi:hypothetical protein
MKDTLLAYRDELREIYEQVPEWRVSISKIGIQVKDLLANLCYKCENRPRKEGFFEFCSKECQDTYRRAPQRHEIKDIKYMQKKLLEMAKAKHVKEIK